MSKEKMTPNELFSFMCDHGMMADPYSRPDILTSVACDLKLHAEEIVAQKDNAMLKRYILTKVDGALADMRSFFESNLEDLK